MAKAVAKKNGNGKKVAVMQPSMFAVDAGVGVNDLGSEDLAIPRIKVLQKMSDELELLDGAKSGDIYNSITKEFSKKIRVINCAYSLQFVHWKLRGAGGQKKSPPVAIYDAGDTLPATKRSETDKKDMTDYLADGSGDYLERTAQHYVLVLDENGMTQQALLPMKSTQLKKSKQWNSAMRSLKMQDDRGSWFTPPRFSHIWNLEAVAEENAHGSWHGWEISKDMPIEDPNIYAEARLFAESIKAGQVKVQHVQEEDSLSEDDVPF